MMSLRNCLIAINVLSFTSPSWAEGNAIVQEHAKPAAKSPAERRPAIDKVSKTTLAQVYQKFPKDKEQIAKAAGYAVFRTGGFTAVFWAQVAARVLQSPKANNLYVDDSRQSGFRAGRERNPRGSSFY